MIAPAVVASFHHGLALYPATLSPLRRAIHPAAFASSRLPEYEPQSIDKSGKMGANARDQMEIAFANVKAALDSVGASFSNIVKLNTYIVDIGTNIAHYREVRDKFVNTSAPPASTAIGVPQLARPGALFEVEAIAVLPPT
jgi:enamine deaminase RidA (YjgF/YER057c/UK114 family)